MPHPSIPTQPLLRCVEPQKRWVGGRFGWAIHRFPIKGGVPVAVIWSDALRAAASRPSSFAKLLKVEP